jgi:hypothetical protein
MAPAQRRMNSTIVPKDDGRRVLVPRVLTFSDILTQHIHNISVVEFHLPVCLGVIGCREQFLDSEFARNRKEEIRIELRSVAG